jgi:hypothetical protein
MSSIVQPPQVFDITNRQELTERLFGSAELPEQALHTVFEGEMQALEKKANTTFDCSLKERAWKAVSKEHLKSVRDFFLQEVCIKILGGFSEDEVFQLLEEHKRTGAVKNAAFHRRLQASFVPSQKAVREELVKRVCSLANDLVPQLVGFLRNEGIEFQIPNFKPNGKPYNSI